MSLFEEHFVPKRNVIFERVRFHIRHLYELAAHCDFNENEEEIRDRPVIGTRDKDISLKLQKTSEL